MNKEEIAQSLDHCLLTEQEMYEEWDIFHDPIPSFTTAY